jgi:hypothetical protein
MTGPGAVDTSEIKLYPGDLLVFIDDTGHETFAGNQPYYGLGGCIFQAEAYQHIKDLWRHVRQQILGDPERPLHAADLPRLDANFQVLQTFFADRSFMRVAAMTTKAISLPEGFLPADAVMGKIQEEIQFVATTIACKRVVLIVESSQRVDSMVRARWGNLAPIASNMMIPMEYCFMPKSSAEEGLEIADFIVNAAGSQTRRYMREAAGHTLDFADVFLRLPTLGCRFSLIRGITGDATGKIVGLDHLRLLDRDDVEV